MIKIIFFREMIPPYHPMQSQPASSGMLKRLLDPGLGPMQLPPHMMSSSLADPLEPPKPKKKRQMQKKPGVGKLIFWEKDILRIFRS